MSIIPSLSISAKLNKLWIYSGTSSRATKQNDPRPSSVLALSWNSDVDEDEFDVVVAPEAAF